MNDTPAVDDRVHVRFKAIAVGDPDVDWKPGRVVEVRSFYGQLRYVVALDAGRRVVAYSDEVTTRPPLEWREALAS